MAVSSKNGFERYDNAKHYMNITGNHVTDTILCIIKQNDTLFTTIINRILQIENKIANLGDEIVKLEDKFTLILDSIELNKK